MKWFRRRTQKVVDHYVKSVGVVELENRIDDRRKFTATVVCACGDTSVTTGYEHANWIEGFAMLSFKFHQSKEALWATK